MKRALLQGPKDFRVEEVEDPKAGPDDVIIRVKAVGLCGSELPLFEHGLPSQAVEQRGLEAVSMASLGHEWSGEVVEVGANVTGVKVGERVLQGGYGGFVEYYVAQRRPMGIPDDMSFEVGATVEPSGIAMKAILRTEPKPGDTVAVVGAGAIGQIAAQIYRALGASKIIVCEIAERRIEAAKSRGADLVVNPNEEDPVKAVLDATDGEGVDIVGIFTDSSDAWGYAFDLVRGGALYHTLVMNKPVTQPEGGKVVMIAGNAPMGWVSPIMRKELTVRGSWGGSMKEAFDLMQEGKFTTEDLITHEFSMDDINEAFEMQLTRDKSIKVLVKP
jgi:threonine dehydrogenase-like Zn-dependent dehydrogenase